MRYLTVPRDAQIQRLCVSYQVVESAGLAEYHRCIWLYAPRIARSQPVSFQIPGAGDPVRIQ